MQPYFHSLSEFMAMGKHGVYVWSCWGMVFTVLIGLIIYSRQQRKHILRDVKHQYQRQQAQKNAQYKAKIAPMEEVIEPRKTKR